jgi:hypothetical protein
VIQRAALQTDEANYLSRFAVLRGRPAMNPKG